MEEEAKDDDVVGVVGEVLPREGERPGAEGVCEGSELIGGVNEGVELLEETVTAGHGRGVREEGVIGR